MAQPSPASTPQKSISTYIGLHTSPVKNQTAAQQQKDETACYDRAKQDSGFDPLAAQKAQPQPAATTSGEASQGLDPLAALARHLPPPPGSTPTAQLQPPATGSAQPATGSDPLAALAKQLPPLPGGSVQPPGSDARAGAMQPVTGAAEEGAAPGTYTDGIPQIEEENQVRQLDQGQADMQQLFNTFKKGFTACMQAKNYVVK
jgi:hypothetical protein